MPVADYPTYCEMLERARSGAKQAGLRQVRFEKGDITRLPLDTASIDVVISNGVLNLMPDKAAALQEMARVLKPDGRLQIADILVEKPIPTSAKRA